MQFSGSLDVQVIESLAGGFDPSELTSAYRRDLEALLEAKLAGQEITRPEPVPETPVVDLMEALKRSVADVQRRKAASAKPAKAPAKKRPRQRSRPSSTKTSRSQTSCQRSGETPLTKNRPAEDLPARTKRYFPSA